MILGITVVNLFKRNCHFEVPWPSTYCSTQCHKCPGFSHHQARFQSGVKCGICAAAHTTNYHTRTTACCPVGVKCDHVPIRCANCPPGASSTHKAKDRACLHRVKIMICPSPNTKAALAEMSHIDWTGRVKVPQLNCAKGQAGPISTIQDIDASCEILIVAT